VWVIAGALVFQALLSVDLVDELKLVIGPMIVGRGRRLLDSVQPMRLELIRSDTTSAGYVTLDYRAIR
jgi:riboflavin biosynthesis pyrimidine reductase